MNVERLPTPASTRLLVALVVGLAVGFVVATAHNVPLGTLVGISTTHAVFVVWGWAALWPLTAEQTRTSARREDVRPSVEELIVVAAALGALVGIVMLLILSHSRDSDLGAAVAVAGVFMSWASLNLMYAVRYAHLYYGAPHRAIDFNQEQAPAYKDFLYFSYNLGMTYQVSDTAVTDSGVRAVVLRHCLMSYLFGAVVLASTINLVAGIASN